MAVDGAALAAVIAMGAHSRFGELSDVERRVFHAVNDWPDAVHPPIWAVMQTGALGGALIAGAGAALSGRRRLGMELAGWGTVTWAACKVIKPLVTRGRPAHHLGGVRIRGEPASGLGFPSGHAAVAATLATVLGARGERRASGIVAVAAAVTGVARIYVGAHLPLDVAGGWIVGWLIARAALRPPA